jgi:hypothetical protein
MLRTGLIHDSPDPVPYLRNFLPLVDETRRLPFEDDVGVDLGKVTRLRAVKSDGATCMGERRSRLA